MQHFETQPLHTWTNALPYIKWKPKGIRRPVVIHPIIILKHVCTFIHHFMVVFFLLLETTCAIPIIDKETWYFLSSFSWGVHMHTLYWYVSTWRSTTSPLLVRMLCWFGSCFPSFSLASYCLCYQLVEFVSWPIRKNECNDCFLPSLSFLTKSMQFFVQVWKAKTNVGKLVLCCC